MTEINFPAGLPLPQRSGYALEHVDVLLRTQMASGRTRARQRFTSAPSRVNVEWVMSDVEAQLFEVWYWAAHDPDNPEMGGLSAGSMPFNVTLQTPIGLRPYDNVKFLAQYQGPTLFGVNHWRFTATLEIAKRPVLSPDQVAFPNEILYSPLFDRNMNRDWPED